MQYALLDAKDETQGAYHTGFARLSLMGAF